MLCYAKAILGQGQGQRESRWDNGGEPEGEVQVTRSRY